MGEDRTGAWERIGGGVCTLCIQFYSLFQLQVSSLLSNVFRLLMTHKVRPLAELSLSAPARLQGRSLGKLMGGH